MASRQYSRQFHKYPTGLSLAYIGCSLWREASQGEWVTLSERCAESCVQIRRSALVGKHRPTIHHLAANDRSMPMLYSFDGSLPVGPALRTDAS